jgi:ribosomal protein S18 acetylase RimI-like enzyme
MNTASEARAATGRARSGETGAMREPQALSTRPGVHADVAGMRELARQAYRVYVERMGQEPAPMTADYERIVETGRAWVAERDHHVVGLLVLQRREGHVLLENVAVAPRAQGQGVGRRLLALAEEEARRQGLPEVRLYTNEAMTENLDYYRRHGYRETHRAVTDGYLRVFFTKVVA